MEIDRSGCEVLTRPECLRLLAGESLGRLGLHAGALPVILPVAYALVDGSVVVRTHQAALLYRAARGSVVAFEVDRSPGDGVGWSGGWSGGWSVHVTGLAEEVTDPDDVARLRSVPLRSWAPDHGDRFIRISIELLTGRRLADVAAA